jgi:hypothetical protein
MVVATRAEAVLRASCYDARRPSIFMIAMAVSAKNRRKLEVDGRRYLWWVAEDEDSPFCPLLLAVTVALPVVRTGER